jgi:hypothetical protein
MFADLGDPHEQGVTRTNVEIVNETDSSAKLPRLIISLRDHEEALYVVLVDRL